MKKQLKKQLTTFLVNNLKYSKSAAEKAVTDLLNYMVENKNDLRIQNLGKFVHRPYRKGFISYLEADGTLQVSLRKKKVAILHMDQKIFVYLLECGHSEKMAIDVFMSFSRMAIQSLIDLKELRITNVGKITKTKTQFLSVDFCSWN